MRKNMHRIIKIFSILAAFCLIAAFSCGTCFAAAHTESCYFTKADAGLRAHTPGNDKAPSVFMAKGLYQSAHTPGDGKALFNWKKEETEKDYIIDETGVRLTEEELEKLRTKAKEYREELKSDLAVLIFDTRPDELTLEEYARDYYIQKDYGYGDEKDCALMAFDIKHSLYGIYVLGGLESLLGPEGHDEISSKFGVHLKEEGATYFTVTDAFLDDTYEYVKIALESSQANPKDAGTGESEQRKTNNLSDSSEENQTDTSKEGQGNSQETTSEEVLETMPQPQDNSKTEYPAWYTENIANQPGFNRNEISLPRVVDDADILTTSQEVEIARKIQAICDNYDTDFVLYTDDQTYGLSLEKLSAEFFDRSGYGVGNDLGGIVLFRSMDPNKKGWRTTAFGNCQSIFSYDVMNWLDDGMDPFIRAEDYYGAFSTYVDMVDQLYSEMNDLPDWYSEGTDLFDQEARKLRIPAAAIDIEKPHVADRGGFFSDEEKEKIEKAVTKFIEKNGVDLVIFTDSLLPGIEVTDYAKDFYTFNGYGKDGILLTIINNIRGRYYEFTGFGEYKELIEKQNYDLRNEILSPMLDSHFYRAAYNSVENLDYMLKHGHMPLGGFFIGFLVIVGLAAGAFAKSIVENKIKKYVPKIKTAESAYSYLVPGSLEIYGCTEYMIDKRMKTTPKYTPKSRSGGSSGGSGGSSRKTTYSRGSTSSGRSYTSGGRNY